MNIQPLQKEPVQSYPNIAWGAISNDGKIVGHRDWIEVVVLDSSGQTLFAVSESESATHFTWAGDGSEFAYNVCGEENEVVVFKRVKHTQYVDREDNHATTCNPLSLCYFQNASGSTQTLMYETSAPNRRGKQDTFTLVGDHDAELHVSGACADKVCIYGIDTDDHRLVGYPHVKSSQYYLFEPHPDDQRPDKNCCATNGKVVAVAGKTMLRVFKCDLEDRDIKWQVPVQVIGKPVFIGTDSILTLEANGHTLVIRDVLTGTIQQCWGIQFALRVLANEKYVVLNMGDGSTVIYAALDLLQP